MPGLLRRESSCVTSSMRCLPDGGRSCQKSYSGRMMTLHRGTSMMLDYGPSSMALNTSSIALSFVMHWTMKYKAKIFVPLSPMCLEVLDLRIRLNQKNVGVAQWHLRDLVLIKMPKQTYYIRLKHVSVLRCKVRRLLITSLTINV